MLFRSKNLEDLTAALPSKNVRSNWLNAGGQLIISADVDLLRKKVREGKIKSWPHLHTMYNELGIKYKHQKMLHALASLTEISGINLKKLTPVQLNELLSETIAAKEWMVKNIYDSRAKDYSNNYRKVVYDSVTEMDKVIGPLKQNSFINQQNLELKLFTEKIIQIKKTLKLR